MNVSSGSSADYYKISPKAKTIGDVVADKPPLIQEIWGHIFPADMPRLTDPNGVPYPELIDLILYFDLSAQEGEIVRSCKRFGADHHSSPKRDLEKIAYYLRQEYRRIYLYYPDDVYFVPGALRHFNGIPTRQKLDILTDLANRCETAARLMENQHPIPKAIGATVDLVRPEWMDYGGPAFNL